MNLKPEQRDYIVYRLRSTLDWISRSEDWFKRSELATRLISIIVEIGSNTESVFSMPIDYIVTEYKNLRNYREKLNEVVDEDDMEERNKKVVRYIVWLKDIGLLRPYE